MAYAELGENLLKRFLERVQDVAKVEVEPKMEGRNMSLIVVPASKKRKKKQQ